MSDLGWLLGPDSLRFLAQGLELTLIIAIASIAISLVIGVLLAFARLSRAPWLSLPATIYIEGMRALPVLLVIFFSYFALPQLLHIKIPPVNAGIIAMSAFTAALIAEIVRAGVRAVPRGIVEAAQARGLTGRQVATLITLPIALRNMMPALVAQFITLLKDTSLTAVIGIRELTGSGEILYASPPGTPIPVYIVLAIVYFTINFGISQVGRRLETRTA